MFYIGIRVLDGAGYDGYMEVFSGTLQRITDTSGLTVDPLSYTVTDSNPTQPVWALPDPPVPPPPPPPVPEAVSKAQFITQLIRAGIVSEAQGIQAATIGELPSAIVALLAGLPPEDQLEARVFWATTPEIRRDSTVIARLIEVTNLTGDEVDDIFRGAGQILF